MNVESSSEKMYSEITPGYYDRIFQKKRGMQSKWHCLKFAHIASLMGNYSSHLDVGCGPGSFISLLDNNKLSLGIDIDEGQISYANQAHSTEHHSFLKQKVGLPFPFENSSFDIITVIELIEHITIEDATVMMKEIYRVLKPNGRVIISTPNYRSLWPVLEFCVNHLSDVSYEEQHITHYTKRKLVSFAEECGFNVERIYTQQFLAFIFASLSWRLSDWINDFESVLLSKWFGFLIIAELKKGKDV